MRVVLLADVSSLGRAGTVAEVSDGYARNYLLPQRLAVAASAQAEAQARRMLERERQLAEQSLLRVAKLEEKLHHARLVIRVRATVVGTLYEGLHPKDIARQLSESYGVRVGESSLTLKRAIKRVGSYTVGVRVSSGRLVELEVLVRPA